MFDGSTAQQPTTDTAPPHHTGRTLKEAPPIKNYHFGVKVKRKFKAKITRSRVPFVKVRCVDCDREVQVERNRMAVYNCESRNQHGERCMGSVCKRGERTEGDSRTGRWDSQENGIREETAALGHVPPEEPSVPHKPSQHSSSVHLSNGQGHMSTFEFSQEEVRNDPEVQCLEVKEGSRFRKLIDSDTSEDVDFYYPAIAEQPISWHSQGFFSTGGSTSLTKDMVTTVNGTGLRSPGLQRQTSVDTPYLLPDTASCNFPTSLSSSSVDCDLYNANPVAASEPCVSRPLVAGVCCSSGASHQPPVSPAPQPDAEEQEGSTRKGLQFGLASGLFAITPNVMRGR